MKIIDSIWIEDDFFKEVKLGYISKCIVEDLHQPYVKWEAGHKTIEETIDKIELSFKTEFEIEMNQEKLNQGFLALKRAFNSVSNVLKINLGIDEINYTGKIKKDFLSTLENLKISRKTTLQNMLDIRNLVEHDDKDAPAKDICILFSEFIWFYIGRVAAILDRVLDTTVISSKDSNNGKLELRYKVHKIRVDKNKTSKNPKFKYVPSLYVFGVINKKYVHYLKSNRCMEVDKFQFLNTKSNQIQLMIRDIDIESHEFILFKGEIVDQDIIVEYVTQMIIPELGGIDDADLRRIFIQS